MVDGAKYCNNCGNRLLMQSSDSALINDEEPPSIMPLSTSPNEGMPKKRIFGALTWALIALSVIGSFITAVLGNKVIPQIYLGIAFGLGILAAMSASKRGRSGLLWFFVGFFALGFTAAFLIGFFRAALAH
jgi:hypothetical protein